MRSAVVQSQQDIKKVAYFAFGISAGFSVLAYLLILAFAEPLSTLLGGGAALVPVLRVVSLMVIIDGLWIVAEALLKRDLKFKEVGLAQMSGQIIYAASSVFLAWMGFGVWSLVYSTLAQQVARLALTWYYSRFWRRLRPQPWDGAVVRSLLQYGVPATGSGLMRYLRDNWDSWLVGRRLGAASLGFYNRALHETTVLTSMVGNTIFGYVLLPSYAKVQNDVERLKRGYLTSLNLVLITVVPVAVGIFILAEAIVTVLLGEQWLSIIPVWQIFSLYALTRPISANASPLFMAMGKPIYNLHASLLGLAIVVPLVLWLIGPLGIIGVAAAVSVSHLITMIFNVYQVNRLLPGTARKTLTMNFPFVVSGGLMAIGVQLAKAPLLQLTGGEYNIVSLVLLIGIGALIYLSLTLVMQRDLLKEIFDLTVKALELDKRWPRLAPQRLRPSK
jgi:PST family polysaccharide transporter